MPAGGRTATRTTRAGFGAGGSFFSQAPATRTTQTARAATLRNMILSPGGRDTTIPHVCVHHKECAGGKSSRGSSGSGAPRPDHGGLGRGLVVRLLAELPAQGADLGFQRTQPPGYLGQAPGEGHDAACLADGAGR